MNEDIVDDALADIALNPQAHNQGCWANGLVSTISPNVCGSTFCLAGFIAIRAGYAIVYKETNAGYMPGYVAENDERVVNIFVAAQEAADMTASEAGEMFISSARDDYKDLVARWNRLTGREQ